MHSERSQAPDGTPPGSLGGHPDGNGGTIPENTPKYNFHQNRVFVLFYLNITY